MLLMPPYSRHYQGRRATHRRAPQVGQCGALAAAEHSIVAVQKVHPCNGLQRLVPAALQLASDESVGRIDSVVLSAGMRRLVACLAQGEFQLALSRCCFVDWISIALTAASIPSGRKTHSASLAMAASMLNPLIVMQRVVPWLTCAP